MKIVPHIGDQAGRVADLCGYLPLALRLAASALTLTPNLNITDYVLKLERLQRPDRTARDASRPLAPARSRMRPVDAVLSLNYDLLVPGLQKLWRMLTAFRDTFDAAAAASVWQINPARAANALDRLMACSLIERNRATGRYRMHDLMAQFADARSNDQERTIARQRFSAHYQNVLHEADALYEQGGGFLKQGLTWLIWNGATFRPGRSGPRRALKMIAPHAICATPIPTRANTCSTCASTRANVSDGAKPRSSPPKN